MRISKRQLRKIILSELQSQRARDDVSAGSGRDDLDGERRPDLELDESDDAAADDAAAAEGEPIEERRQRITRNKLRQMIREEKRKIMIENRARAARRSRRRR
tara:strand:+ start:126 stop:434 length:309 start_codon:yes stop_codon:yes gene_type:complete